MSKVADSLSASATGNDVHPSSADSASRTSIEELGERLGSRQWQRQRPEYWLGKAVPPDSVLRRLQGVQIHFSYGDSLPPPIGGASWFAKIAEDEIRASGVLQALAEFSDEQLTVVCDSRTEHPGARLIALRLLSYRTEQLSHQEIATALELVEDRGLLISLMAIELVTHWPTEAVPRISALLASSSDHLKREAAIEALSRLEPNESLRLLLDCAENPLDDDERSTLALAAARWCSSHKPSEEQLERVLAVGIHAALDVGISRERREALASALQPLSDWERKLGIALVRLEAAGVRRHEVDTRMFVRALGSPDQLGGIAYKLTKRTLKHALGKDRIVTGKLAALLIEAYKGDPDLADLQVQRAAREDGVRSEHLQSLRLQIGGMPEVMEGAAQFKASIQALTDGTINSWERTTERAAKAFYQRLFMSRVVFVLGTALVVEHAVRRWTGTPLEAFEIAVPLVALASMMLVFYSAPISDVRQSVTDLAVANVAFVGYVHTILSVSHKFAYDYLSREVDYEKLDRASELVARATNDAVNALRSPAVNVGATHIKEAMDAWLPIVERLQHPSSSGEVGGGGPKATGAPLDGEVATAAGPDSRNKS